MIVVIIAIVLYIRQIGKIEIIPNMLITVCIITMAISNLGIIQKDLIRVCNDLRGNDININCDTMTTRCFNDYINFKYNSSNVNKQFICQN